VVDAPKKSSYDRAAVENADEEAVARLLDEAKDVTGWVYNHRSGVGYFIEYDWQGLAVALLPGLHRARPHRRGLPQLHHRGEGPLRRPRQGEGPARPALLRAADRVRQGALALHPAAGERASRAARTSPGGASSRARRSRICCATRNGCPCCRTWSRCSTEVEAGDRGQRAARRRVPLRSARPRLAAAAGGFGESQAPASHLAGPRSTPSTSPTSACSWPRWRGARWKRRSRTAAGPCSACSPAVYRPRPRARWPRVVVQLRTDTDPEHGGSYTLKRWHVASVGKDGGAQTPRSSCAPTTPTSSPCGRIECGARMGRSEVIAEFLEGRWGMLDGPPFRNRLRQVVNRCERLRRRQANLGAGCRRFKSGRPDKSTATS
jgi:hypothetical protein